MALAAALAVTGALSLANSGCTIDTRVATVAGDAGLGDAGGGPRFVTLSAGSTLPDEATCAARVRRSTWEPRPLNKTANEHLTTPAEVARLAPWDSAHDAFDDRALGLQARITGDFAGTTDEILQWAACKWGFDEDHLRAEAVEQSGWNQGETTDWTTTTTDCPPNADTRPTDGGVQCAQTYGIMQILWKYHQSAWPMFRDGTSFHLDYVYALRRACFEGYDTNLSNAAKPYVAGDEWGCVGAHFSGAWYDSGANAYITRVKGQLAGRAWTRPDF
jgi:hypothetical protein